VGETAPGTTTRSEAQQQAFALLTDPEVGLDLGSAALLAVEHPFGAVRDQVFRFVRDRAAGAVRSPAIIKTRLTRGFSAGPVLESDRQTALWARHTTEAEEAKEAAEEIRRRYAPDEYRNIILG
jgi:hypothetical protein